MESSNKKIIKSFTNTSLRFKFGIVFLGFFIVSIFNYLGINYYKNLQDSDAIVINVAGRQRMLSQRIAFLSERIIRGQTDVRQKLSRLIKLCDSSLDALKMGGAVTGLGENVIIPPGNKMVMATLLSAEDLWLEYKANAERLVQLDFYQAEDANVVDIDEVDIHGSEREINKELVQAVSFIENNAQEMLIRFNDLVKRYVEESSRKQEGLSSLLYFLLVLNLAMIGFGLYILNKYVRNPITIISHTIEGMSKGKLTSEVSYRSEDEIGQACKNLRDLRKNIFEASEFAVKIGNGEFDTEYHTVGVDDKLGQSLIEMREKLINVAEEDRNRIRQVEGLAKLNDIIRSNQEKLEVFTDEILAYLVNYLKANQGVLFILNDEHNTEQYMEVAAYYAWGDKKIIEGRVNYGEGLAGRVWAEGKTVYLREIPENYVKVTSGLGHANPTSIIIVPMKVNQKIYGIIEIASLSLLDTFDIDFLEKVAEDLAASISSSRINIRTKRLLEQTQQQTEEMRAQEEEMRQNMEELQATQEEMQRKEREYLDKIALLENGHLVMQPSV